MTPRFRLIVLLFLGAFVFSETPVCLAQGVTPELALRFKPIQKHVEFDTPEPEEVAKCSVKVVQQNGGTGWIVTGPQGELLRKFMDTNGDNTVDQWSYFRGSLEVYRDLDSNFNKKVDQSRWLNTGGARWGIDDDEDGKIDRWRQLSIEELCELAFYAMQENDPAAMQVLMVTAADLQALGVRSDLASEIREETQNVPQRMKTVVEQSDQISSKTEWLRYDAGLPGAIPADAGKAKQDLQVYENARGLMDNGGEVELLQIGELLLVGRTWKLISLPKPIGRESGPIEFGGILLRPSQNSSPNEVVAPTATSAEARALLDQLQKLDENSPDLSAGPEALGRYNKQRADILQQLVKISKTAEERDLWLRQLVDGITAAVQTGAYKEGLDRLVGFEQSLKKQSPESDLVPYVSYRRLTSEYSLKAVSTPTEEQETLQKWWLGSLEQFVTSYPKSDEAPDAAFQIASSYEIGGRVDDAQTWYRRIVATYGSTIYGQKAKGALRRLNLEGEVLDFSGKTLGGQTLDVTRYRGKVVVLVYWATWCRPCLEELPQLQGLYKDYHDKGLEVIGINLDLVPDGLTDFVRSKNIPWPQIREDGGLDSPPAVKLGILMPPAMILVDRQGKVVSSEATVEVLKEQIPQLLK